MTKEQKAYLECFKIAAEFCGQTNKGTGRVSYDRNDVLQMAHVIAERIDII